jgi:hypothetical protein
MLVVLAFQQLGNSALMDPVLAAWTPLMIFVPTAAGLAGSMWK